MQSKGLLAVQGALKLWSSSTPQFKSFNPLVLSFLYSPNRTSIHDYQQNIALTRRAFVGKVMSPLLNMLSRLVITFLPRRKCLLISLPQSPSAVILSPQNKVYHCSAVPFSSCPQSFLEKNVSSSHQVAKVLELQLQHQFFQRIFRTNFL